MIHNDLCSCYVMLCYVMLCPELANETLRLIKIYRDQGVIGIDISDDALLGVCLPAYLPVILPSCLLQA